MLWTLILILILSVIFVATFGFLTATEESPRAFSWPLFFIFLLSLWIFGAYLQPLGMGRENAWLAILIFGIFLLLFSLALTPTRAIRGSGRSSPTLPADIQSIRIFSLGFFVWLLLFYLVLVLAYSTWYFGWRPWYLP